MQDQEQQSPMFGLIRDWWNYCFDNPDKIKPIHSALYFFMIEHNNRLAWKTKFGLPTTMAMEAMGVKNYRTYIKAFKDIEEWGFIKIIERSKNQHSSNIIALVKNTKAHTKALDKAMYKHSTRHSTKHSTKHVPEHGTKQGQSTVSIDRPIDQRPETRDQRDLARTRAESSLSVSAKSLAEQNSLTQYLDDARAVAVHLLTSIVNWDKHHKYAVNPPNIESWAQDIARAMKDDGRTKQSLIDMFDYLFTQDTETAAFWAANIYSGAQAAKHFDIIRQQATAEQRKKKSNRAPDKHELARRAEENRAFIDEMYEAENE